MLNYIDSWKFTKQSVSHLLKKNKDILFLGIIFLLAMNGLLICLFTFFANNTINHKLILIIVVYLCLSAFITYYQALVTYIIFNRLNAQPTTISEGIYHIVQSFFPLLVYSFLFSTVGLLNKILWYIGFIGFFLEPGFRSTKFSYYGYTNWTFITYFILPILVTEKKSLKDASEKSENILGRGWKKTFSVSRVIGTISLIICIFILSTVGQEIFADNLIFLFCLLVILTSVIIAVTLEAVEKSVLYTSYGLQKISYTFNQSLLDRAFAKSQDSLLE